MKKNITRMIMMLVWIISAMLAVTPVSAADQPPSQVSIEDGVKCIASVESGYLAIRTSKTYDDSNIIGKLNTGDVFIVTGVDDDTYCYGYSPKDGSSGFVNFNYLYVSNDNTQAPLTSRNRSICPICNGSGQQYIPNLYYDVYMGWYGGYVACSGCGSTGYIG